MRGGDQGRIRTDGGHDDARAAAFVERLEDLLVAVRWTTLAAVIGYAALYVVAYAMPFAALGAEDGQLYLTLTLAKAPLVVLALLWLTLHIFWRRQRSRHG